MREAIWFAHIKFNVSAGCKLVGHKDPVQSFNPERPDSTRDAPFKPTHAHTIRHLQLVAGFRVPNPNCHGASGLLTSLETNTSLAKLAQRSEDDILSFCI